MVLYDFIGFLFDVIRHYTIIDDIILYNIIDVNEHVKKGDKNGFNNKYLLSICIYF